MHVEGTENWVQQQHQLSGVELLIVNRKLRKREHIKQNPTVLDGPKSDIFLSNPKIIVLLRAPVQHSQSLERHYNII